MSEEISQAFNAIKEAMASDPGYAWSWHCNIAMASVDEGMEHDAANKAAARFMYNCFGVRVENYDPSIANRP